jgi:hypothetical protein
MNSGRGKFREIFNFFFKKFRNFFSRLGDVDAVDFALTQAKSLSPANSEKTAADSAKDVFVDSMRYLRKRPISPEEVNVI